MASRFFQSPPPTWSSGGPACAGLPLFLVAVRLAGMTRAPGANGRAQLVERKLDGADVPARGAGEEPFSKAEGAEISGGLSGSSAPKVGAPARSAGMAGVLSVRDRLKLAFHFPQAMFFLEHCRLHCFVLVLETRVLGFAFGKLGLQEPKVLAKHRRRAALGYQAIYRIEQVAKNHQGA